MLVESKRVDKIVELDKPSVPARAAFDGNLTSFKHPQNGIPVLFVFNALLIASNGTDSRVGSLTADWERRASDKLLYEQKCSALFEHIFESYPERDAGVYAAA